MSISHSIDISAPTATVWGLTVAVEGWPDVSPTTMTSVERLDNGPLQVGSTARIVQPRQRPSLWTVTQLEPGRVFVWTTRVVTVVTTAIHRIEPTPHGCRNTLSVELGGFGSGLVRRLVGRRIQEAIATENEGFRRAAEASAAAPA